MSTDTLIIHHSHQSLGSPADLALRAVVEHLRPSYKKLITCTPDKPSGLTGKHLMVITGMAADDLLITRAEQIKAPIFLADMPLGWRHADCVSNQPKATTIEDIGGTAYGQRYEGGWASAGYEAVQHMAPPPAISVPLFGWSYMCTHLAATPWAEHITPVSASALNTPPFQAAHTPVGRFLVRAPDATLDALYMAQKHLAQCGTDIDLLSRLTERDTPPSAYIYIAGKDQYFDAAMPSMATLHQRPLVSTRDVIAHHKGTYWPVDNPNHPAEWIACLGALSAGLELGSAHDQQTANPDIAWNTLKEALDHSPVCRIQPADKRPAPKLIAPSPLGSIIIGAAPGRRMCAALSDQFKAAPTAFFLDQAAANKLAALLATPKAQLAPRLDFENHVVRTDKDPHFDKLTGYLRAVQRIDLRKREFFEIERDRSIDISLVDNAELQRFAGGWSGRASERVFWRDHQGGREFLVCAAGMAQVTLQYHTQVVSAQPDADGIALLRVADSISLPLDSAPICRLSMYLI